MPASPATQARPKRRTRAHEPNPDISSNGVGTEADPGSARLRLRVAGDRQSVAAQLPVAEALHGISPTRRHGCGSLGGRGRRARRLYGWRFQGSMRRVSRSCRRLRDRDRLARASRVRLARRLVVQQSGEVFMALSQVMFEAASAMLRGDCCSVRETGAVSRPPPRRPRQGRSPVRPGTSSPGRTAPLLRWASPTSNEHPASAQHHS